MARPRKSPGPHAARTPAQPGDPPDLLTWKTKRQTAAMIGKSVATVNAMILNGELRAQKDESGTWRVDPDTIEQFVPTDQSNAILATAEVITAQKDQIKVLFDYLLEVTTTTMKLLHDENSNMRELRGKEQKAHLDAIVATQNALDFKAEREAQIARAASEEAWKKDAIEMGKPALNALLARLSGPNAVPPELLAVRGLLARFTEDDLNSLAVLGKMNPAEYEALQRLRGKPPTDCGMPDEIRKGIEELSKTEEAASAAAE